MNSVYGIISTEPIYSLPELVGPAYLPYFPGCVYAALPSSSDSKVKISFQLMKISRLLSQGFTFTFFESRPVDLIYHNYELHVFDLKVYNFVIDKIAIYLSQTCHCADISFGTVDEVMNWVGEPVYYHCIETCKVGRGKVSLWVVLSILNITIIRFHQLTLVPGTCSSQVHSLNTIHLMQMKS